MDDLTVLGGLRADAPEPGADRLDALRARALRRRRSRLAPPLLLVAAATGVVVVMVSGVGAPVREVPPGPRPMSAEVVLQRAAQVSERHAPARTPRAGQWLYWKLLVRNGTPVTIAEEYWTRFDGTAQASRRGQGAMEQSVIEPEPGDDQLTPREFAAKFAELPTDPARLLAHVKDDPVWQGDDGEHPDARAFRVLSVYLYQELPVPPKLRGAIFRALAEIPGVRVDSGVRDAAGRTGIGVAYEGDIPDGGVRSRSYLIFDDTTYEFLGRRIDQYREERVGPVVVPPGIAYVSAVMAVGVVDRPGELPG
ncbi:CU044_5270 family protein [Herbidospora cretacea]|uniref:CU044_5270 family protein n=1 Tax=Herbidospora cretacea TaxID=28444 RepID=UPI0004C3DDAF|nr:CU044_5270 family protein [Herbidospora cretacea]